MASVTLTAGARPIFLNGNFLTRHADSENDLVVSTGTALRHRLYDMDPAAPWQGETADDDTSEFITFGLWQPGFQGSKDVDFLAALGINAAAITWDLSNDNGATYPGANQQAESGIEDDYVLTSIASAIAADKIKVAVGASQTGDDSLRQVGAIVVGEVLLQPTIGMSLFNRLPQRIKTRTAVMHDGSTRRSYIYRSDASVGFHDFNIAFSGLDEDEADSLMDILMSNDPFIFIPEPGDRPNNMYLGQAVPGTVARNYLALSKSGGELVSFDFEEMGGA